MRGKADAQTTAAFVEDNIYLGERWIVTPGLRFDHHSQFGNNTSPSLNAQFRINSDWVVKGGIARVQGAEPVPVESGLSLLHPRQRR